MVTTVGCSVPNAQVQTSSPTFGVGGPASASWTSPPGGPTAPQSHLPSNGASPPSPNLDCCAGARVRSCPFQLFPCELAWGWGKSGRWVPWHDWRAEQSRSRAIFSLSALSGVPGSGSSSNRRGTLWPQPLHIKDFFKERFY